MTNQAEETPTSSPGRFSLALEGKARGDEVGETRDQRPVSRKSRKLEGPEICRGVGVLGLIFAGFVPRASQNP